MSTERTVEDLMDRLERSVAAAKAERDRVMAERRANEARDEREADRERGRGRCCCHESAEAWRRCPVPYHDHSKWTEHGWNCPPSCAHPDAAEAGTNQ